MNHLQALFRLQTLESSLDGAKERLGEIEKALLNSEALQKTGRALEAATQEQNRATAEVTDLELESASLSDKIIEVETLLYSGKIGNPREIQERQDELQSLKRRHEKLTSDITLAKEMLAQRSSQRSQAQQSYDQARAETEAANADLFSEEKHLRTEMMQWLDQRKTLVTRLKTAAPDYYKAYKQIKPKKGGIAIARLEDDMCSVCHSQQTISIIRQVKQAEALILCTNCGRYLIEV